MLIELSKQNAPSLLLQDYNYLINKAITQYINKQYNTYDFNQQSTDSLKVLKSTCFLEPKLSYPENKFQSSTDLGRKYPQLNNLYGATYEVELPKDYLHLLNCICIYQVNKTFKCYDKGSFVQFAAKRLTSDLWSNIINDYYQRPLPERPYYFIHNVNKQNELLTNEYNEGTGTDQLILPDKQQTYKYLELEVHEASGGYSLIGTLKLKFISRNAEDEVEQYDSPSALMTKEEFQPFEDMGLSYEESFLLETNALSQGSKYIYKNSTNHMILLTSSPPSNREALPDPIESQEYVSNGAYFNRDIFTSQFGNVSAVEKPGGIRYSNPSTVRMEIRYGKDNTVFELKEVLVDYVKSPQHIRLTQEQLDLTEDTSQIIEFPDYVCQEIINELVAIVMENTKDDRLQTHVAVTQSIAQPTQQQTLS